MKNIVKDFFDSKASIWDKREIRSDEYMKNLVNKYCLLKPGMKALDLGCGTGIISKHIFDITKIKVTAIDLSDEMIKIAKTKFDPNEIEFIAADFYKYEFNEKFDIIICHNAYPHFLDLNKFIEKVSKSLQNDGIFIIIHSIGRELLKEKHKHLTYVSRELKDPINESIPYLKKFKVINYEDNEDMYLLAFQKI